ncbi:MAG: hypothetical protein EOP53_09620 [Sphingobacteriales bacterium]|nr:MAG: hypothetical protein EOP53_09620 [Sphingobacteriales bacterium]
MFLFSAYLFASCDNNAPNKLRDQQTEANNISAKASEKRVGNLPAVKPFINLEEEPMGNINIDINIMATIPAYYRLTQTPVSITDDIVNCDNRRIYSFDLQPDPSVLAPTNLSFTYSVPKASVVNKSLIGVEIFDAQDPGRTKGRVAAERLGTPTKDKPHKNN